jgi:serine/threonine protein kinase
MGMRKLIIQGCRFFGTKFCAQELITRDEPYRSCTKPDIIVGVVNRDLRPELPQYVQDLLQRTPPTLSSGDLCVHGLATIMVACWNRDPNMRPNFQQIIEGLQELKRRVEESLTQEERSTGMDGLAHSDPQPLAPLVLTHQSHQTRDLNDAILARDKSDVVEQIKRSTSSSKSDDSSKPEFTHSWELDVSELTWDQKISETKSATVWKGKYRAQDVAVKVVNENVEGTHLEEFKKEIAVLSSLRSPYMTFFYGCSLSPKLLIVTEFIPGALSLQDLMTKGTQRFDWELVISIALDSAKAINQLHSWRPQVLHRDIKVFRPFLPLMYSCLTYFNHTRALIC